MSALRSSFLALAVASGIVLAYDAGRRRERACIGRVPAERDRRPGTRPAAVRTALESGAVVLALMDALAPKARAEDLASLARAARPAASAAEMQLARIEAAVRERRLTHEEALAFIDFPPLVYPDGTSASRRYLIRQKHLADCFELADKVRREADLSGDLSELFALARASSRLVAPSGENRTSDESGVAP